MKSNLSLRSITWTLISVPFFLIVCIFIIGYYYYQFQKNNIINEAKNELTAVAELKVSQIVQWRNERADEGKFISENSFIIRQIESFFKKPDEKQTRSDLVAWMKSVKTSLDYSNVFLCDLNGIIKLAAVQERDSLGLAERRLVSDVILHHKVMFSEIHSEEAPPIIFLDMVVPLVRLDKQDSILAGVLMLRIDLNKILFPLVQSWHAPSRTAETLLFHSEGDSIFFVNNLHHYKNTALTLHLPIHLQQLPAVTASRGIEGTIEGIDYQNIPVFASFKKIPNSTWFLITKIDQEEIYSPFHRQMTLVMLVVILIIFVIVSSIGFLWRRLHIKYYKEKYKAKPGRQALILHFDYFFKVHERHSHSCRQGY